MPTTPRKAANAQWTTASHSDANTSKSLQHGNEIYRRFIFYAQQRVPRFAVDEMNQPFIHQLLAYFSANQAECQTLDIDLKKGLLLMGPVGCGKTTLMKLCEDFFHTPFRIVASRKISQQFVQEGYAVLVRYGARSYRIKHMGYGPIVQYNQPITYCLDDVGAEPATKHFGNDCNVIAEILQDRYEQFTQHRMITHLTTNLNADELAQYYGHRVRSRLREMGNLISFSDQAPDRRA